MPSKQSRSKKQNASPLFTRTFAESEINTVATELVELVRGRITTRGPVVVSFMGPMGAGKSTLIRACLNVMRADGDYKGSPTYALAHEYETSLGRVAHMDWYRIESSEELESMGMREYLGRSYSVLFIEWADRYPEWVESTQNQLRAEMTLGNISVS